MLLRRGYYPKGGGELQLSTKPVPFIKAVQITDRGEVTEVRGRAFVAGVLPVKVIIPASYIWTVVGFNTLDELRVASTTSS